MEQWEIDIREKYKDLPEGVYDLVNALTSKQGFIEFEVALYRHYHDLKQSNIKPSDKVKATQKKCYSSLTLIILEDFIKDLSEQKEQNEDSNKGS